MRKLQPIGKQVTAVGKQTGQVKQTRMVGKSEYARTTPGEEPVDAKDLVDLSKEHTLIDESARVITDLEAAIIRADREEAERKAYGLHESINQQKGLLFAERETEYYMVVVFQSAEQKKAFFDAIKWNYKEKGGLYVDGEQMAMYLRIPLPEGPKWKDGEPKDIWDQLAFEPGDIDEGM